MATETSVKLVTDKAPDLEAAQKAVGGYVELVKLRTGQQMLVNEEGLLKGLAPNPVASLMAGRLIVGNVLVLDGKARWK